MTKNLVWLPSVSQLTTNSTTDKLYYVYGYDGTDVAAAKANDRYTTYGVLYNWPAAIAACPAGWPLPSGAEWKILEKFLGMSAATADSVGPRFSGDVGGKLKEAGTSHWQLPNRGTTNSSGFTALPGGWRGLDESDLFFNKFRGILYVSSFWSSTVYEINSGYAYGRYVLYSHALIGRIPSIDPKSNGYAVRCIKD